MRITYRILLVGGIPITIAAAIALAAFVLLNEADRARSGAALSANIYRLLLSAGTTRDDFLDARRGERTHFYELFNTYTEQARFDLRRLGGIVREQAHVTAVQETGDALQHYTDDMRRLLDVTLRNDQLAADMASRTDSLVKMTDEARERQHRSNADIVTSLADGDRKLRVAREIVDRAHEFSAALSAMQMALAMPDQAPAGATDGSDRSGLGLSRLRGAGTRLGDALTAAGRDEAKGELDRLLADYEANVDRASRRSQAASPPGASCRTGWSG